jgi:hypothetical protein
MHSLFWVIWPPLSLRLKLCGVVWQSNKGRVVDGQAALGLHSLPDHLTAALFFTLLYLGYKSTAMKPATAQNVQLTNFWWFK